MSKTIRKRIANGVHLTIVPHAHRKSSLFSASFVVPLGGIHSSAGAVLPYVLQRGTIGHPTMQKLAQRLEALYGASMDTSLYKMGESLLFGINADVLSESYALEREEPLTKHTIDLLQEVFYQPFLKEGVFLPEYVQSEIQKQIDRIESQKNNLRTYAVQRLHEVMCQGEAFAYSELGDLSTLQNMDASSLYASYVDILQTAPLELFYAGNQNPDAVEQLFLRAFQRTSDASFAFPKTQVLREPKGAVRTIIEEKPVRQGKLSIGFRTGVLGNEAEYPALMLLSNLYGGSTNSRLFTRVREEKSLCYYASSTLEKYKGIMTVASGIENADFQTARDAILEQLQEIQAHGVQAEELEIAKRTVQNQLRALPDSPMTLKHYWQGQAMLGMEEDVPALMHRIDAVTLDEIQAVAKKIKLDTIYFLKGVAE